MTTCEHLFCFTSLGQFPFHLCFMFTVSLLVSNFVGDSEGVSCFPPAHFESKQSDYVNRYCKEAWKVGKVFDPFRKCLLQIHEVPDFVHNLNFRTGRFELSAQRIDWSLRGAIPANNKSSSWINFFTRNVRSCPPPVYQSCFEESDFYDTFANYENTVLVMTKIMWNNSVVQILLSSPWKLNLNLNLKHKKTVFLHTKQESPPAWTQEVYRPPCSKSLGRGGVGTLGYPLPPSWPGQEEG